MAQWDQLFGTDKSFKEYVLEVVKKDEVSTLKYDDIKEFLDMYVLQANGETTFYLFHLFIVEFIQIVLS